MAKLEITNTRTETSKTFNNGNGTFTFKGSTGPIHYKEDYGNIGEGWKDIDVDHKIETLECIEYDRMPIIVRIFKDRVGYEVVARKTGHKIIVELESQEPSKEDVEFVFDINQARVRLWKDLKTINASKAFKWKITEENKVGEVGSLRFREKVEAFDRDVDITKPAPEEKKHEIITKKTPIDSKSFYWEETAPKTGIKIDTDVNYYSDSGGDGSVQYTNASWDTCHDATDGAIVQDSYNFINTSKYGASYRIERGFYPFDTSGLPDNATVIAATLRLRIYGQENSDNDGDDFMVVVQTTQASNTNLVTDDFETCGDAVDNPTEGSDRIDLGDISTGSYETWTLNTAGKGWIDNTGWTKLGMREGHDVLDHAYAGADSTNNYIWCITSEYGGTTYDPRLSITYDVPSVSRSISPSPSVSPSISPSASESASISPSASNSPSISPSASISPSGSVSPSASISSSQSPSISPSGSESASDSPSVSPSASTSPSGSTSASDSPSLSPSASISPSGSTSPSVSPSISPSTSESPSASASPSPSPAIYADRYVLNGTNLPRPKFFRRDSIFVARDVRAISGKEGRDKTHRKEKFVLGWDILVSSELDTILSIVNLNTPVTFSVGEENLTIAEMNVIVSIVSIRYTTPGENYICETEIELIQVE